MSNAFDPIEIYNRLQKIHVLLDDGDRRALTPLSLTSPQYQALSHLFQSGERGLTITELADKLICTRGNATRRVQVLETGELVRIDVDPSDLRLKRVRLTEAGRSLMTRAREEHNESINRRLRLSEAEFNQLNELTTRVVTLLEQDLAAEQAT